MKYNNLAQWGVVGNDSDRCTGTSTGLALKYISEALLNPNQTVIISDHFGSYRADRNLFHQAVKIIDQLGLKCFETNRYQHSICFNLWSERVQPDRVLHNGKIVQKVGVQPTVVVLEEAIYE